MEENDLRAFEWWMKAAEQGDAAAQCSVGCRYAAGEGVEQKDEKAVDWFKRSANQNYVTAQLHLGHCYEKGEGVDPDYDNMLKHKSP